MTESMKAIWEKQLFDRIKEHLVLTYCDEGNGMTMEEAKAQVEEDFNSFEL